MASALCPRADIFVTADARPGRRWFTRAQPTVTDTRTVDTTGAGPSSGNRLPQAIGRGISRPRSEHPLFRAKWCMAHFSSRRLIYATLSALDRGNYG
ncbi:hypothetical protein MRX96_032236 [Rhipicephalus microplus]